MKEDLLYKIAITRIEKVGVITAKNLVSYCGGARAVFESTKKALVKIPGIGPQIANSILRQQALIEAERELDFIESHQIQALFFLDEDYPKRLKQFHDCPIMLYYRGHADLNHPRVVAIVGTRKPSEYGKKVCRELIESLLPYQALVISGLAYGIDILAHRKCLEWEIPTVGVLGHGLQLVYPGAHRSTAQKMVAQGGLLTEFGSDQGPEREHFPMRNRIIAGLCDALVVVETGRKGGSMISAEMAYQYHKDVFAFPGRTIDQNSKGSNQLIKSHKAALIESGRDIAFVMRWEELDQQKTIQKQFFVDLAPEEQQIVNLLLEKKVASIDQLSGAFQLSASQLAALLLQLEFKGVLRSLPGQRYTLCK
ncbi:MAG: DNA-processing protein DprA [Bacteroidota bacterium]